MEKPYQIKALKAIIFETTRAARQGCVLSALLFFLVLDAAFKNVKSNVKQQGIGKWKMEYHNSIKG